MLCANSHVGYSRPIGSAVAYRDHISPSGVGYDIGCGSRAMQTGVSVEEASFEPQRHLLELAASQLGTVGSSDRYVGLFEGGHGEVWIVVHSGSRGFGNKTASGFLAMAEGKGFNEQRVEGEMDSPHIVFVTDTDLGQAYIEAMGLAGT